MKRIEYRALTELEDFVPLEAEEYAKQKLRMKILDDQDYELEVLKDLDKLRQYVASIIDQNEKTLASTKYSALKMLLFGDKIRQERDIAVHVSNQLKDFLSYIVYLQKIRNEQLKKKLKWSN